MTIVELLQKDVYRIDRLVGNIADELRLETLSVDRIAKLTHSYNDAVNSRTVILECIEKLKPLNI